LNLRSSGKALRPDAPLGAARFRSQ
jgi:hypothetical protein